MCGGAGRGHFALRSDPLLPTAAKVGKSAAKNRWFLAAFFSIFLSLLKEIWPPEAYMRKQNIGGGRGRTPPLRRIRREYTGIRWCADTGRRGRRPLRRDRRECAGIRGCADTGRRGRRPLRGARPETWRDTCGRGVSIGGVQTRDAGAGGVFRRTVIEWRRKPQNQHRRALR